MKHARIPRDGLVLFLMLGAVMLAMAPTSRDQAEVTREEFEALVERVETLEQAIGRGPVDPKAPEPAPDETEIDGIRFRFERAFRSEEHVVLEYLTTPLRSCEIRIGRGDSRAISSDGYQFEKFWFGGTANEKRRSLTWRVIEGVPLRLFVTVRDAGQSDELRTVEFPVRVENRDGVVEAESVGVGR